MKKDLEENLAEVEKHLEDLKEQVRGITWARYLKKGAAVSSTILIINAFALFGLVLSFLKDITKTKDSMKVALKSFTKLLPVVLIIIILIGWMQTFISKEVIAGLVGKEAGSTGVVIAALLGSVLHIPSLVAFPLAASLLKSGASVMTVAAFITTLTMVGFITLPMEVKELGKRIAFLRNGFSFVIAIVIALLVGVILR